MCCLFACLCVCFGLATNQTNIKMKTKQTLNEKERNVFNFSKYLWQFARDFRAWRHFHTLRRFNISSWGFESLFFLTKIRKMVRIEATSHIHWLCATLCGTLIKNKIHIQSTGITSRGFRFDHYTHLVYLRLTTFPNAFKWK